MATSSKRAANKKDIFILVLIVINFILAVFSLYGIYKINERSDNMHILITRHGLVSRAKDQCLSETGKIDCDYVKIEEEQFDIFNEKYFQN